MFTGLIEEVGSVRGLQGNILHIGCRMMQDSLALGDSIAVNGVCLTIVGYDSLEIGAEIMPVTMSTTNLGFLKPGMQVNLERAVRMGDRLGGHLVSGHVDATATIVNSRQEQDARLVTVKIPLHLEPYVIEKGSIAIDGISLTVAHLDHTQVAISLVGHTKTHTTLASKKVGDLVNVECDQLGKYVQRLLTTAGNKRASPTKDTMSMTFLQENGFTL
ncbi:riboflavin synthase [Pleomorphochaeta sp. DL1XJH-081]|jgi:riboflavin synthase|uniref:riboflavin synthase n=1 Tax=Pleomorphochaeta sp. DL1XJH-081 TaxID=3409690 RepID=UPI003BB55B82